MVRTALVCLLFVTACSHRGERELTALEHRVKAAEHEARAEREQRQYDPTQSRQAMTRSPFVDLPDGPFRDYNPTSTHLARADRELRAAAEHSKAAAKLEAFEDAACQQLPSRVRAACPLLASQVAHVQDIKKGVLLTIKPEADAQQIEQRLQCHLAFARANGFDKPSCPLFVKGMRIRLAQPKVIALEGSSAEVARALQAQARRVFQGPETPEQQPVSSLSP